MKLLRKTVSTRRSKSHEGSSRSARRRAGKVDLERSLAHQAQDHRKTRSAQKNGGSSIAKTVQRVAVRRVKRAKPFENTFHEIAQQIIKDVKRGVPKSSSKRGVRAMPEIEGDAELSNP